MKKLRLERVENLSDIKGYEEIASLEQMEMKGGGWKEILYGIVSAVTSILPTGCSSSNDSDSSNEQKGTNDSSSSGIGSPNYSHDNGGNTVTIYYNKPDSTYSTPQQPSQLPSGKYYGIHMTDSAGVHTTTIDSIIPITQ